MKPPVPPQLVLALGHAASLDPADFIAAPCNEAALAWIARYPDWPAPLLALHGPAGSGKTHLVHLWLQRAAALGYAPRLIDPASLAVATLPRLIGNAHAVALDFAAQDLAAAPGMDQRALLHLYNMLGERGGHVLAAAQAAPARWAIALADLRSRLAAAPSVAIAPPDDALLAAVLVKLFADRQRRVDTGLIEYLVRRGERSLAAAGRIVAALDHQALALKRPVGVALARELLERMDR